MTLELLLMRNNAFIDHLNQFGQDYSLFKAAQKISLNCIFEKASKSKQDLFNLLVVDSCYKSERYVLDK